MEPEYIFNSSLYQTLGTAAHFATFGTIEYFRNRRDQMLDFYLDNIMGKPEHEKPSFYIWAEEIGLIGDVPTEKELPRLEKKLGRLIARRAQKRARINSSDRYY